MALHLAARKNHDDIVRSQSDPDRTPDIGLATDLNVQPVFRDATRDALTCYGDWSILTRTCGLRINSSPSRILTLGR